MKLIRDKKSGRYLARVIGPDGKSHQVSTGVSDKKEAKIIAEASGLKAMELVAKSARMTNRLVSVVNGVRKITMPEAIKEYGERMETWANSPKYIHESLAVLNSWMRWGLMENWTPADVIESKVHSWINGRVGLSAGWRKFQLSVISAFLEFCLVSGYRIGNPARLVRVDLSKLSHEQKEVRPRAIYSDDEVARLVAVAEERHGADGFWPIAIVIARQTGLRLGDICNLQWASLADPTIIVCWTRKKDKRVLLPVSPPLRAALDKIPRRDETYCFPYQHQVINNLDERWSLSSYFKRLCGYAGIEGKNFHDFRSTALTDLQAKGMPVEHIMQIAGHSNWGTTKNYIKS